MAPLGLRVDRSSPLVDARLPDGSRVNAVVPPVAIDGPCLTIRRFGARTLDARRLLLARRRGSPASARSLARRNILVTGGTGSGKTTLLNSLGGMPAEPRARSSPIEDAAELRLPGEHVVRLEARPASAEGLGAITIRELVRNALAHAARPHRRRRGPRRRGARHAPSDEHRPRGLALDVPREQSRRRAAAHRDDGAHGRRAAAARGRARAGARRARPRGAPRRAGATAPAASPLSRRSRENAHRDMRTQLLSDGVRVVAHARRARAVTRMSPVVLAALLVVACRSAGRAPRGGQAHRARSRFERCAQPRRVREAATCPSARTGSAMGRRQRRRRSTSTRRGRCAIVGIVLGTARCVVVAGPGAAALLAGVLVGIPTVALVTSGERRRRRRQQPAGCARRDRPFAPVRWFAGPGDRRRGPTRPQGAIGDDLFQVAAAHRAGVPLADALARWRSTRPIAGVRLTASGARARARRRRRARPRHRRSRGNPARQPGDHRPRCEHRPRRRRHPPSSSASRRSGSRRSHAWPTTAPRRSCSRRQRASHASRSGSRSTRPGAIWMGRITRTRRMSAVLLPGAWAARDHRVAHGDRAPRPVAHAALLARDVRRARETAELAPARFVGPRDPRAPGSSAGPRCRRPARCRPARGAVLVPPVSCPLLAPAAGAATWAFGVVAITATAAGRSDLVRRTLPEVVDLFVVGIGAGLNVPLALADDRPAVPGAVRRRTEVDRRPDRPRACALADALEALPTATRRDRAPALERARSRSERYGVPLTASLERLADEVRRDRRRHAEADGASCPRQAPLPLGVLQPARARCSSAWRRSSPAHCGLFAHERRRHEVHVTARQAGRTARGASATPVKRRRSTRSSCSARPRSRCSSGSGRRREAAPARSATSSTPCSPRSRRTSRETAPG